MRDATHDHRQHPCPPGVADPGVRVAARGPRMDPIIDGAGAAPGLERLLAHLRAVVTQHVRSRRAAGVPVERVLPELRALVREAEAREGWRDSSDALLARVYGWGVDAYEGR